MNKENTVDERDVVSDLIGLILDENEMIKNNGHRIKIGTHHIKHSSGSIGSINNERTTMDYKIDCLINPILLNKTKTPNKLILVFLYDMSNNFITMQYFYVVDDKKYLPIKLKSNKNNNFLRDDIDMKFYFHDKEIKAKINNEINHMINFLLNNKTISTDSLGRTVFNMESNFDD